MSFADLGSLLDFVGEGSSSRAYVSSDSVTVEDLISLTDAPCPSNDLVSTSNLLGLEPQRVSDDGICCTSDPFATVAGSTDNMLLLPWDLDLSGPVPLKTLRMPQFFDMAEPQFFDIADDDCDCESDATELSQMYSCALQLAPRQLAVADDPFASVVADAYMQCLKA
jgi:hypothetical protein